MGRVLASEIGIYLVLGWCWVGTRYSTPPSTPVPHYPGYTPPRPAGHHVRCYCSRGADGGVNMAVGLISVGVRTLDAQISDIKGITEVYNLANAGNR